MSQSARAFDHRSTPRVFCIGRNYAKHIEELGNRLAGARSVVFMKPASCLVAPEEPLALPREVGEIHHEAELVVEIGRGGRDIAAPEARAHIAGLGLGLDLTARDLQANLKSSGEPWERAKAFEASAPLGPITPLSPAIDLTDLSFSLQVDGATRQAGHTGDMLVAITELVAMLSRTWALIPGDLIFTGTPEGVGALVPGQTLLLSSPVLGEARWQTA